jgi:hypothetical protein
MNLLLMMNYNEMLGHLHSTNDTRMLHVNAVVPPYVLFPPLYHFHLECQCTIKHTTTHIHKENVKNLPTTSTKAIPQQTTRTRHPKPKSHLAGTLSTSS